MTNTAEPKVLFEMGEFRLVLRVPNDLASVIRGDRTAEVIVVRRSLDELGQPYWVRVHGAEGVLKKMLVEALSLLRLAQGSKTPSDSV